MKVGGYTCPNLMIVNFDIQEKRRISRSIPEIQLLKENKKTASYSLHKIISIKSVKDCDFRIFNVCVFFIYCCEQF